MGITDKGPALLNVRYIKQKTSEIFAKYSEVRCAYLFGSYARGEATTESDVDIILVVEGTIGFEFAGIKGELEKVLGKDVDLVTPRQMKNSEEFLKRFLNEAIRIYKKEK